MLAVKPPTNYQVTPIVMAVAGNDFTYGDGTTWYGRYLMGSWHSGNGTTSVIVNGDAPSQNKWMALAQVNGDNADSYTLESVPRLDYQEMTALPQRSGVGLYDPSRDRWVSVDIDDGRTTRYSEDNGQTWISLGQTSPVNIGSFTSRKEIVITESGNSVYYVLASTTMHVSSDGGASWVQQAGNLTDNTAWGLCYNPPEDRFYAAIRQGNRVDTQTRSNLGSNWSTSVGFGTFNNAWAIDSNPNTGTVCCGVNSADIARKPLGGSWTYPQDVLQVGGTLPQTVMYVPEIDAWFASVGGRVYKSTDDGLTWPEISFPSGFSGGIMMEHRQRYIMYNI